MLTGTNIKGTGKTTKDQAKVYTNTLMVISTRENGSLT